MDAPDYAYYSGSYGGTATEAAFDGCLPRSVALVGMLVGRNESESEAAVTAYKRAVCAAADSLAATGAGGSLSIGSVSLGGMDASQARQCAIDAATAELATSGLLWAGLM